MPYKDPAQQKLSAQRHYERNKEKMKAKSLASNKEIRIRNLEFINTYKSLNGCVDCGISNPIVLDFDHLDGSLKRGNLSDMARCSSLETIQKEIEKCELVCANCHRIRTHARRQS